jgi:hypothetical protein
MTSAAVAAAFAGEQEHILSAYFSFGAAGGASF